MLRKISKQLKISQAMFIFAQNLLQASMLGLQSISKELKELEYQKKLCGFFIDKNFKSAKFDVICGSSNIFGSDFNLITKEQHHIKLGICINGMSYDEKNLPMRKELYAFKYMNFHKNKVDTISFSSEVRCLSKWPYNVIKSDDSIMIVELIILKYIFTTIRYHEQFYRSAFMNNLVYNCNKKLGEVRNKFFKARSSFITQQLILQNNNVKNK